MWVYRIILILNLFGCVGVRTPAPKWHLYQDIQKRNHIYNIDLEKLSLSGENLTEHYYCLTHERLEEIKIFWPITDSTEYTRVSQDF